MSLFSKNFTLLNLYENSETIYGVKKQPPPTCPLIDGLINQLSMLGLSEKEFLDVEEKLEKIRKNVSDVRSWGQEWKDLVKNARKNK
ncbi:MAG TPA: hypothetical protein PLP33_25275 [Leptospiraceae bacterium]|nr:hypothetical protein [Leptospiraceae bacterium]